MLRQKSILDMFARSPIRPLQLHMQKAHACVEQLTPFYRVVQQGDWDQATAIFQKIRELEHEADDLKRDVRIHLPKNLFLPVSRGDLLGLLTIQESLANIAKDIAGIMLGRRMIIPEVLSLFFEKYLARAIDASRQAMEAIDELDELLESGFRGKEVDFVAKMIKKLDSIEHETDEMQISLRQGLFNIEENFKPVQVIFFYKIIEWIGKLADKAQQAGYQLQLLLAA